MKPILLLATSNKGWIVINADMNVEIPYIYIMLIIKHIVAIAIKHNSLQQLYY